MERLTDSYVSMMGFHASLKICRAGLMLVTDIALSCFLEGGDFVELMAAACGFRNFEEPLRESQRYFAENEHGRRAAGQALWHREAREAAMKPPRTGTWDFPTSLWRRWKWPSNPPN